MSYKPTGFLASDAEQQPNTSSLFAYMTEGGRDPARDEYLRRVGHMAGTKQLTRTEILLPGATTIMPPWKIG